MGIRNAPAGASIRGRWLMIALILCLSVGGVTSLNAMSVTAAPRSAAALEPFEALGLPAGPATGVPSRLILPAGTNLKHVHGGPTYVYVLSGYLDIVDSDGSRTSYSAGDFFSEPPGHVHTVQVTTGNAEVFVLQFLPPGAEATVPVQ